MDSVTVSTRLQLIATAERLFAEQGINAVSVRKIAAEAGQRNSNAVRYHFGSKQDLVDAIFEHRMAPLNAHRSRLIDTFDGLGRARDPYALAEAFVLPLAALLDGAVGSWYLRFCVQSAYTLHPDVATLTADSWEVRPSTRGLKTLRERTIGLLSDLPPGVAVDRWGHFTGFLTHALADREARQYAGPAHVLGSTELFVAGLVDAAVAILTAPCRETTLALAAHQDR